VKRGWPRPRRLEIGARKALLKQPCSSAVLRVDGRATCVAHAASPGYETSRSGWHSLILPQVGDEPARTR